MKKLGVALSSGGARGYAHIGVLKVLDKNNIPVHSISGTSMGAVVAAYYALNRSISGLEKVALSFKQKDYLSIVDFNDPRISIIKGDRIRKFLKSFLGDKQFSDTKIPLAIGASSMKDGSAVVFTKGSIIEAIVASGAFPGIFPPYKYKNQILFDGGLAEAIPVDLVKDLGAEAVVAVDLFSSSPTKFNPQSNLEVLARTYELIMLKLSQNNVYGKDVLVLKPKAGVGFDTFAFDTAGPKIKAGEAVAKKNLKRLKELIG